MNSQLSDIIKMCDIILFCIKFVARRTLYKHVYGLFYFIVDLEQDVVAPAGCRVLKLMLVVGLQLLKRRLSSRNLKISVRRLQQKYRFYF
jgi:hypothetical protein